MCRAWRVLRKALSVWRIGLVAAVLVSSGCNRYEVRVYDAPKERIASRRAAVPEGWMEIPRTGMRMSTYIVRGSGGREAQVSVVPMAGAGGSELDNVNRWRAQLGLQPISQDDLPGMVEQVTIAGEPGRMFEIAGKDEENKATRTLAAALEHAGTVWFFKMMGEDSLVREQKEAFVGFIASYEIPHDDHTHDAPTTPPAASSAPAAPVLGSTNWAVPATWRQTAPGAMQSAKFLVADGKANVTLSVMAGSGGGLLANINRWRVEQLQLPPAEEKDVDSLAVPLDLPDAKGRLIDMRGPTQRMVVAIVPREGSTWYFKLMGEEAVVAAEKKTFVDFVKSSR